jgi:fucose 4-O-acetylase-like acetyltransferase
LTITTLVQGGIRDCWGVMFFAMGVIYRRHESRIPEHWTLTLLYAAILVAGAWLGWQGMALKTELRTVATLPFTGAIGFLMVHHIASWLDRHEGIVKRFMVYCGNNTLYIYVWHIISFKLVSAIKIWYYGLDWGQIGCHMVIHENSTTDLFWVLYTIVGTAVPLLGITLYRHLTAPKGEQLTQR